MDHKIGSVKTFPSIAGVFFMILMRASICVVFVYTLFFLSLESVEAMIISTKRPHFVSPKIINLAIIFSDELNLLFTQDGEDLITKLSQEAQQGKPLYWPEYEKWPLESNLSIVNTLETIPPQYELSNGKLIRGKQTEKARTHQFKMQGLIEKEEEDTKKHLNTIITYAENYYPNAFKPSQEGEERRLDLEKIKEMKNAGTIFIALPSYAGSTTNMTLGNLNNPTQPPQELNYDLLEPLPNTTSLEPVFSARSLTNDLCSETRHKERECRVCFNEMSNDDMAAFNCGHVHCRTCIDRIDNCSVCQEPGSGKQNIYID